MARIPNAVTAVRGCTCGGSIYHRSSEPRCALLDIDDPDDVQARLDEAEDRTRAYTHALNERLRAWLASGRTLVAFEEQEFGV